MNRAEIAERNRRNASKSTGPKTAEGKARVSQNARRHGGTARACPESKLTWLRIVLENPDHGEEDMLEDNAGMRCALALADAEAQLAQTIAAQEKLIETGPSNWLVEKIMNSVDIVMEELAWQAHLENKPKPTSLPPKDAKKVAGFMLRATKYDARSYQRDLRLACRYLREARSRRKRAFQNWLGFLLARDAAKEG